MTTTMKRLGVMLLPLLLAVGCAAGSESSGATTTAAEVTTTAAPVADSSACIDCHTSEETLRALAVEEDTGGETLSEGEG